MVASLALFAGVHKMPPRPTNNSLKSRAPAIRADLSIRSAARRNARLKFAPLTAARHSAFIPNHTARSSNLGKTASSPPL